tara:strand:+ start:10952 stop:11326 length:375 start_codon:yes stop_codon:yes gene_type:complete
MAVAVKSSGVSTPFSIRIIDASDLEHTGLSDFISSSTTVYTMDLDNAAIGNVVYFKVYDSTGPTYGTTDPSLMIKIPASTRQVWSVAQGLGLSNGLSIMASAASGPTATIPHGSSSFNCSLVVS